MATLVRDDGIVRVGSPDDNPSPRRQGLLIEFSCETCGMGKQHRHILQIYQHKGQTYVEWAD